MKLFFAVLIICLHSVTAKSGFVKNSKCSFPFVYKGETFNHCTTVNSNKPWCSLHHDYNGQWVYCEEIKEDNFDKLFDKLDEYSKRIKALEDKNGESMKCRCHKELKILGKAQRKTTWIIDDHERRMKENDKCTKHIKHIYKEIRKVKVVLPSIIKTIKIIKKGGGRGGKGGGGGRGGGGKKCRRLGGCGGKHRGRVINLAKGKRTSQSSVGWGGDSSRAVDGRTNQHYGHKSCTHTQKQAHAWWQVDLGHHARLTHVVIYNRADCCGQRLSNFAVLTSRNGRDFKKCANYGSRTHNGQVINLKCRSTARFVRIQLRGHDYLTLCEVKVFGHSWRNPHAKLISVGKKTIQSSTGWGGVSSRAVDGRTSQHYGHRSCTHTHKTQHAWWQVDLGYHAHLDHVVIYNRADCCGRRLSNFAVLVSNKFHGGFRQCARYSGITHSGQVVDLDCRAKARFLRIQLQGNNYLTLCEVQVFGLRQYRGREHLLSFGKHATQSSHGWRGAPSRAVDGNTKQNYGHHSCTHTALQTHPWWQVNLSRRAHIHHLVIYNRADCCGARLSNFMVLTANSEFGPFKQCAHFPGRGHNGQVINIKCRAYGQFVRIQLRGRNYLTLCEVKVYGH